MKKCNNNFYFKVTLDLTLNAWKGHMAQKVGLSILESLELYSDHEMCLLRKLLKYLIFEV